MRVLPPLVVSLLALASMVDAGSSDAPEITDPADDHTWTGGLPDEENLIKSVDLIKGWVAGVTDSHLELRLQTSQEMRGGNVAGNPTTQYDYDYHFTAGGESFTASGHVVGPAPPTVTPQGVASEAFIDPASSSTLVLIVPLDAIGGLAPGDAITGMSIDARVHAESVTLGTDRAPDDGFGLDFIVPEAQTGLTYVDVDFPVSIEHGFDNATDAAYQINWTSPGGNLTGVVLVDGTGNLTLDIAVGNQSVHSQSYSAAANITLAGVPAGNGTMHLAYAGFAGNVSLQILPEVLEALVAPTAPGGNQTGNTTLDDAVSNQDSPALAVPLLVAGVLVAVWRRR